MAIDTERAAERAASAASACSPKEFRVQCSGWSVECGVWRVEGGGWRVEGGGYSSLHGK